MQLKRELVRYQAAKERLLGHWPEIDCETLVDTLEGITDLHEMIAAVIRSALVDEALHAGLRFRVDDMRERLSRLELRASKKRQLALEAMTEVGLTKLEQPDFTASARAGSPALVVIAEDKIPEPLLAAAAAEARSPSDPRRAQARHRDPRGATEQSQTSAYGEDKVMALSDTQVRQLRASSRRSTSRRAKPTEPTSLCRGWHVIAEANRIFGYDAWDRRTLASRCVWSGASGAYHAAAYTAKVRVSVRAGDITIVREGSGTGEGKAPTPGQAHELALKGAETDATKRALATFGNPFGLALYDREQVGRAQSATVEGFAAHRPVGAPLGIWCRGSKLRQTERVRRRASKGDERGSRYRAPVRHLGAECRNRARSQQKSETRSFTEVRGRAAARGPPQAMRHRSGEAAPPRALEEIQAALIPGAQRPWPPEDRQERAHHQRTEADRSKEHLRFVASSLVSFAGDRRRTRITSASPNPRGWRSR